MKKILSVLLVAASLAMFSCTTVSPVAGATGKIGSKTGEASAKWFMYPYLLSGDASIVTAARNGGISTVGTVDVKNNNMFFMGTITTIVTGE